MSSAFKPAVYLLNMVVHRLVTALIDQHAFRLKYGRARTIVSESLGLTWEAVEELDVAAVQHLADSLQQKDVVARISNVIRKESNCALSEEQFAPFLVPNYGYAPSKPSLLTFMVHDVDGLRGAFLAEGGWYEQDVVSSTLRSFSSRADATIYARWLSGTPGLEGMRRAYIEASPRRRKRLTDEANDELLDHLGCVPFLQHEAYGEGSQLSDDQQALHGSWSRDDFFIAANGAACDDLELMARWAADGALIVTGTELLGHNGMFVGLATEPRLVSAKHVSGAMAQNLDTLKDTLVLDEFR